MDEEVFSECMAPMLNKGLCSDLQIDGWLGTFPVERREEEGRSFV